MERARFAHRRTPCPLPRISRALPRSLPALLGILTALASAACHASPTPPPPDGAPPALSSVPAALPHPHAAPSDLPASVARALETAKRTFGPDVDTRVVAEAFVLVGVGPKSPLLDTSAALLARAVPALLDGRMDKRPTHAVTALLYADAAAFKAYCRAHYPHAGDGELGVYGGDRDEIVVDLSGGAPFVPTLTHEAVHALMDADFPLAPTWLREGMASLYEAPRLDDAGIRGVPKNRRTFRLRAALASPQERGEVTIAALFAMNGDDFEGRDAEGGIHEGKRSLHYAMARQLMAWLEEKGALWRFYRGWRDGWDADPRGVAAFERATGRKMSDAEGEWGRWVR